MPKSKFKRPKEIVLRIYPKAYCEKNFCNGNFYVYRHPQGGTLIAGGPSAHKAWEFALKKLRGIRR